jgi:hypothetical protein
MIIGYVFIIGMLTGSLEVSRKIGGKGGKMFDAHANKLKWAPARWASKPAGAITGAAYRGTVGKGSNALANSTTMRSLASTKSPILVGMGIRAGARGAQDALKKSATASGDFRNIAALKGTLGAGAAGGYKEIEKINKGYTSDYNAKVNEDIFNADLESLIASQQILDTLKKNGGTPQEIKAAEEDIKKRRDAVQKSLAKIGDKNLDQQSTEKLIKIASHLNASQFNRLIKDKEKFQSEEDRAKFIEARMKELNQIDLSEKDYREKLGLIEDKELEILVAHTFNTGSEAQIKRLVENMPQNKADKIKNAAELTDDQRKEFKKMRKESIERMLGEYKNVTPGESLSPENVANNKKVVEKLKKVSGEQMATMDDKFFKTILNNKDLIKVLESKKHLSKIFAADLNWTDEASGLSAYDYIAQKILSYKGPNGERHPAAKFFKGENLGMLSIDVDAIEKPFREKEQAEKDEADLKKETEKENREAARKAEEERKRKEAEKPKIIIP